MDELSVCCDAPCRWSKDFLLLISWLVCLGCGKTLAARPGEYSWMVGVIKEDIDKLEALANASN